MANSLANRCFCLLACFCLLLWPSKAVAQFEPGNQQTYPYYYPNDDLTGDQPPTYSETPSPITNPIGAPINGGFQAPRECSTDRGTVQIPTGYTIPYNPDISLANQRWISVVSPLSDKSYSIQVNKDVAANASKLMQALNDHLKDQGDFVTAWGNRTFCRQVGLRIINGCADNNEDVNNIFELISDEHGGKRCRTATARPGRSNHEQGRALDISYIEGGIYEDRKSKKASLLIRSRSEEAFRWLNRNTGQGQLGFKNLPIEPWHWSVDGR